MAHRRDRGWTTWAGRVAVVVVVCAGMFEAGYHARSGGHGAVRLAVLPPPSLPATAKGSRAKSMPAAADKSPIVAVADTATALPVTACADKGAAKAAPSGGGTQPGFVPDAYGSDLTFFQVGSVTILGPLGWQCSVTKLAGGGTQVTIEPVGPTAVLPRSTASGLGVVAEFLPSGQASSLALTCPFFVLPRSTPSACQPAPATESSQQLTDEVVTITDPAYTPGSLPESGGSQPVTGVLSDPANAGGTAGTVAEEACAVTSPPLCTYILGDFMTRNLDVAVPG